MDIIGFSLRGNLQKACFRHIAYEGQKNQRLRHVFINTWPEIIVTRPWEHGLCRTYGGLRHGICLWPSIQGRMYNPWGHSEEEAGRMGQVMKNRAAAFVELKGNEEAVEAVMERIAHGQSVKELARELDVPYVRLWSWLTKERTDDYRRARQAQASLMADSNAAMADGVERGDVSPKAATGAASIRQWLASRYDRDTFGDRSQVDMRVQGSVDLHLAAVRQLTQGMTYEHEAGDDAGPDAEDDDYSNLL